MLAGVLAIAFTRMKIPDIAAYLAAGVLAGPVGAGMVTDPTNNAVRLSDTRPTCPAGQSQPSASTISSPVSGSFTGLPWASVTTVLTNIMCSMRSNCSPSALLISVWRKPS